MQGGSSRFRIAKRMELVRLPNLTEVTSRDDRLSLFIQKLRQCAVVFDFGDSLSDLKEKEIKRSALNELQQYLSKPGVLVEEVYPEIISMFAANAFRTLSPPLDPNAATFDPEEDEPILEISWPHLHLVYQLFLSFLQSAEFQANIAKKYLDSRFVEQLLELFDSLDPRERECSKTILHRVYAKILSLRTQMRRSMNNIFFRYIYETENHNGLSEMLEIYGSIINGFTVPLKKEHVSFLEQVLLPLFKSKSLQIFFPQLSYCVRQFVDKDGVLLELVLSSLLKFWPRVNSPKEVLVLTEVEELLECAKPDQFFRLMLPIYQRLARCISSPHFQVAERALYFLNNDKLFEYLGDHAASLVPILFPVLYRHSKHHWNHTVHSLIFQSLKMLSDVSPALFDECTVKYKADQQKEKKREREREDRWKQLEALALKNPVSSQVTLVRPRPVTILGPPEPRSSSSSSLSPTRLMSDASLQALATAAASHQSGPPVVEAAMRRKSMLPADESTQRALRDFHLSGDHSLQPM